MIVLPEFTEDKDESVVMYFAVDGKKEADVIKAIENTYYCYSRMDTVTKDGKKYIALEIEGLDEDI